MISRTAAVMVWLGCAAALGACGGRSRAPSPQASEQARALAAADSALANPGPLPAAPQTAAGLAGSWALRTGERTRRGPLLDLAIDSVTNSTFRVRVAFLMSGDVGIDPARFEATSGSVSADGMVRFSVRMRERAEPLGQLSGTVEQDTIRLQTFSWAGEDQMVGGTRWLLVRQPAP